MTIKKLDVLVAAAEMANVPDELNVWTVYEPSVVMVPPVMVRPVPSEVR